jgi:lantibiotic leader peptide-processing serine protease
MTTRACWRASALAVLSTVSLIACQHEQTTAPSSADSPSLKSAQTSSQSASPHHIFIMKAGVPAGFAAAVRAAGGRIVRSHKEIGVVSVAGLTSQAAARLALQPGVEAMSLDRRLQWLPPGAKAGIKARRRLRSQSDQSGAFFFPFQWNIRQIRADDAWLRTPQGSGALVCVLDTGVDPNHIDLAGKVDLGKSISFVPGEPSILDFFFHGTAVASIITSNGLGVASVAPDARLCAVKVLDRNGSGTFEGVIAGIMYAADVGADVINMSFSAVIPVSDVQDPSTGLRGLVKATQRAVDYARKRGTLSVAAASNDGLNRNLKEFVVLPADLHQVVSVGATAPVNQQNFDRVASYSNFGKREVDVFAPGGDLVDGGVIEDLIFSACSSLVCGGNDFYVLWAGTSAAAPHVVGEAAVIESSLAGDQFAERLEHCIVASADRISRSGRDPVYGKGRINVLAGANCRREH